MSLQNAAVKGDLNYLKNITDSDRWFTSSEYTDYTLLNIALENRQQEVAAYLLHRGCRVNKSNVEDKLAHNAVLINNPYLLNLLIQNGASVDIKNTEGDTPLHVAFKKKHVKAVELLLPYTKSLKLVNNHGLSNLHIACAIGCLDVVKHIIEKPNIDINNKVHDDSPHWPGFTPLHFAASNGHEKIISLLLKNKANVTIQDFSGSTALHLAYQEKYEHIVRLILSWTQNFNINPVNKNGLSYFHIVCSENMPDIIKDFIDAGVNVNEKVSEDAKMWPGCTSLHIAVEADNSSIVRLLLQAGADVNAREINGLTPLHIACRLSKFKFNRLQATLEKKASGEEIVNWFMVQNEREKIVKLLIEHKTDVNAKDNTGKTPMLYLYNSEMDEIFSKCLPKDELYYENAVNIIMYERNLIVKDLLKSGADVNISDNEGMTFLHTLADNYMYDYSVFSLVHDLMKLKVNVNVETKSGITPLYLATTHDKNDRIISLILKSGADPNIILGKNLSTPLHNYAAKFVQQLNTGQSFEDFVDRGADIDHRLQNGKNVLHVVFSRTPDTHCEIRTFSGNDASNHVIGPLLTVDCDLNAQDSSGKTCLHYACIRHDEVEVELLLNYGADVDVFDNCGKTPLQACFRQKCDALVLLVAHVRKLQRLKLAVCEENVEFTRWLLKKFYVFESKVYSSQDDLSDEAWEIGELKKIKLDKNSSLYSVLHKTSNQLVTCAKHTRFRDILKQRGFASRFPQTVGVIERQFRKGVTRALLLMNAVNALNFVAGFNLPYICSEKILDLLDNRSLRNLIVVKPPVAGN